MPFATKTNIPTSGYGWMKISPLDTAGNVFWVDSGAPLAKDSPSHGTSPEQPFATLDYAIGRCTASNNDVINVAAGHAETYTAAAGFVADIAGVRIQGWGAGTTRPTFTFTTATTADVDIDAANVTITNCIFVCGIDSQAVMIDVNATDFTIQGCLFKESSATGLTCIDINGGAANACDRAMIDGCDFWCVTAANWDRAIELGEVADGVTIQNCRIMGDFDDAGIHNVTGKVLTNLSILGNWVQNMQTGDHAIELVSACTGVATDNYCITDTNTIAFDAGALSCANNKWLDSAGGDSEGGPVNPLLDQATNFIGVDDSDNAVATTNVAANEDGSVLERLEQVQEAVNKGSGTALAANKSLVDALGTDGSTVTDSAVSVLGAIGANSSNNSFSSSSVVADRDGSVLERLEYILDAAPRLATVTSASPLTTGTLFTFTKSIIIYGIIGRVTTAVQAQATTVKLSIISDALAAYDICGTVDANAFVAGTMLSITGTAAGGMVATDARGAIAPGQANPVFATCVTSGTVKVTYGAASTGVIAWEMLWAPLATGATVA